MPDLRELQADFLEAVLGGARAPAAALIAANGIDPGRRVGIYANNVAANFLESLRLSYPAVLRLVGADYFAQTVRAYRADHPSRSGDLQHAGAAFPAHLDELHGADQYRYLGDVARLEWLYQECLLAADHGTLDLARLAAVPVHAYDGLRFALHPSLRLFQSPFPVHAIWEANLATDAAPEIIDLDRGGERLALLRRGGHVEFLALSAGELAFLDAVGRRETFAAALSAAADADAGFDAEAALRRLVTAAAIVDFSEG